MNKYKLSVHNLSKGFNNSGIFLPVLDRVNMNVQTGEFVSIIGPSGCGKSTFFDILAGVLTFDCGTVEIDGEKISNLRGHTGYMFQNDLLMPWRSCSQNIMVGSEIRGDEYEKSLGTVEKLLKEFNLYKFAHYYPRQLSGGMRQRIALLRTIAFNSDILLLDEPFGSLDALTRISLRKYLISLWKKLKLTILFITHDIHEAITLSDRIFVFSARPSCVIRTIKLDRRNSRTDTYGHSAKNLRMERQLSELLDIENI